MKAMVIREYGDPDVLKMEEVPDPVAGPGEIVIKVHSVSVNRSFDLLVRKDGNNRGATFPIVCGADPAGLVSQVGEGVTDFAPGDRVSVMSSVKCGECRSCRAGNPSTCANTRQIGIHLWGGYAEYVKVPAANAVKVPSDLSFAEATVITRHAPAAFNQIDDRLEVKEGEWVLVMGAAGALGSCCVQVAKLRGAHVIAAAGSDERVAAAVALGADHGVNYRTHDLEEEVRAITGGEGVDAVCENIGDPTLWDGAFNSLAQNGRLSTMGAHGGGKVTLDIRRLYGRRLRLIGAAGATRKNLEDAFEAAAAGRLKALIDRIMPLSQAADAHRLLENDNPLGKVILDPTM